MRRLIIIIIIIIIRKSSTSATYRSSSTRQTDALMAGAEIVVCNGHSKCSARMSQLQKWPLSQTANKSSAECSVCHAVRQLHISNGTVHRHGPRHVNPCHGSDKPPAAVQSLVPSSSCHDTHASVVVVVVVYLYSASRSASNALIVP